MKNKTKARGFFAKVNSDERTRIPPKAMNTCQSILPENISRRDSPSGSGSEKKKTSISDCKKSAVAVIATKGFLKVRNILLMRVPQNKIYGLLKVRFLAVVNLSVLFDGKDFVFLVYFGV